MSERKKTLLYRTSTDNTLAQVTDLETGELAMNFSSNSPFLMFKNNLNTIEKVGTLTDSLGESEHKTVSQKAVTLAINGVLDFYEGSNTVTTLSQLPITKKNIIANVAEATTLSLSNDLTIGKDLLIRVTNTSVNPIIQQIPNDAKFSAIGTSTIEIPAGSSVEISIVCYDTSKYSIKTTESNNNMYWNEF